eukprot:c37238_g1_i1 orf=1-261(-)
MQELTSAFSIKFYSTFANLDSEHLALPIFHITKTCMHKACILSSSCKFLPQIQKCNRNLWYEKYIFSGNNIKHRRSREANLSFQKFW